MNESIRKYLSEIGKRGGTSGTGKAKSRGSKVAKKAALARWSKHQKNKHL